MIKELIKNWRTTLAGLLACGFAAWFLYQGDNERAVLTAIIGFGLISGKDSLNKTSNNP